MRKILDILFPISWTFSANGQLDDTLFEGRTMIQEADSDKLFLGLNILGFSMNNEYFV